MNDKRTETHACDSISRQAAMDAALAFLVEYCGAAFDEDMQKMLCERFDALPTAQPEPAIPISWLEKEIERLESRKNSFAVLDAMQLKALIKRWESEQNDTDDTD